MKYRKKAAQWLIAGLIGTAVLLPAGTAWGATGWISEGSQWKYYDQDGSVHKGWVKTSDGTFYFLDLSTGYMATGWKQINGSWY